MDAWNVIDAKDQDRIWALAVALVGNGSSPTLTDALQRACAEFFAAERALQKGLKFLVLEEGEEKVRRVRVLENGTWDDEPARTRPRPTEG